MRYFIVVLLFIIALVFQSTLFAHLTIAGVKPDLVLILVILFSFLNGSRKGAAVGAIGGLMQDLLFGQYLGLNMVTKFFVGFSFGFLERKIYKENLLIPILVVFAGSFVNDIIYYFFRSTVSTLPDYVVSIEEITIYMALYNSLLTLIIYRKFYKSTQKGWLNLKDR